MDNQQEIKQTIKNHRRPWLRVMGLLALLLLVLQMFFYVGADFFFRNFLTQKVEQASDGKYSLEFDRFHILFLQRGVSFKNLRLIPHEEKFEGKTDIPYYHFEIPDISITGIGYLIWKKEISIGRIKLQSPDITFRLQEEEFESASSLQLLQEEIKKSFFSSALNEIRIKMLLIEDADLLMRNFISQKGISAENTRILLEDIQLLNVRKPSTPFNAQGFEFSLDNFQVLLADSIHTIKAASVNVSSLKQEIQAKNVQLVPDLSIYSGTYFQLELKELALRDADINKVFETKQVDVGSLQLEKPEFVVYSYGRVEEQTDLSSFDLYTLIDGLIKDVKIAHLQIFDGKFSQKHPLQKDGYLIHAGRIDFEMEQVYIGPEESRKKDQFFYAQHATLDLSDLDMSLGDSLHWLSSDFVHLSSKTDSVKVLGLRVFPIDDQPIRGKRTFLMIDLPELSLSQANLKKTYNQGLVDIERVVFEQPDIVLENVGMESGKEKDFDLSTFYKQYLSGIYIGSLEIEKGSLVVDNHIRVRQDSLSFGKISLKLENFAMDESTESSEAKGIFWADNFFLELEDYALKLSDNLHVFKADRLLLDTRRSQIRVNGFAVRPLVNDKIQETLDRYGKSTVLDIFVPQFVANGVDIPKAYKEGILDIAQIQLPSPEISVVRYRPSTDKGEGKGGQKDVLELITSYFSEIRVGGLDLVRGSLNYENYIKDNIRTFSEDNVGIRVKNFHIHEDSDPEEVGSLFAEEVDLSLSNYVFNLADGKYSLTANKINLNTAREEITTEQVILRPSEHIKDKTRVSATIPRMAFTGVDLEAFLFDNILSLDKVRLTEASVNVLVNDDLSEATKTTNRRRRERNLPKKIDVVRIDTILAERAAFVLDYRSAGKIQNLVNTGIDIQMLGFHLDSASLTRKDLVGFFSGLSLGIDEFWLTLPDSVHQVTFSKVSLDSRTEAIFLNNLRVIPKDLSGKPGSPVFSGHIPRALIRTHSLAELKLDKDIWIKEMTLFRPDLEIFVDEVKKAKKDVVKKEAENLIVQQLRLDDFQIVAGNLGIFDKNSQKAPRHLKDVDVTLSELKINLQELDQLKPKDLLQQKFTLLIPNYELLLKDSLNRLRIGQASISSQGIRLLDVSMEPRLGQYQYHRQLGQQADVAKVYLAEVLVKDPDLDKLLEDNKLIASSARIRGANAEIFRDKRWERVEGLMRPMPQALMRQAGISLQLDSLQIEGANIRYSEFPEKGMVPGTISFQDLNVVLYPFHLSENPADFLPTEAMLLANAELNGEAALEVQVRMLFEPPYPMSLSAQLGAFDADVLNTILAPNAFVKVLRGKINEGNWSFIADDEEAKGEMVFLYEDLKLQLLDPQTLQRGRGRLGILTFVLNTFAVKSNNPRRGVPVRQSSRIYVPRNREKFVFNYWWKATLSGIQGSVGLGQPKEPKREGKREKVKGKGDR